MIVLSMSRFEEAGAFRDFRDLCSDLISRLTKKLSDGLKDLEKGAGHGPKQVLGKFVWLFRPGVESSDNRVHMPYGLLYLVGRLVERYISDFGGGEATEDPVIEELRYLLVKEACRSQFREIRTKSYEILFTTLVSPLSVEMLAEHKCRMLVPWETAEDQEWSMKQWDENAKFIVKRRTHVDNYLERLDLEDIWGSRERADKFPQNGPLSGVCIPLTPPQESLVMQRDPSNRLDLTTTNSRPIYYTPQSPLSSVYTVDPLIWKENPKPFNTRDPLVIEPVRNKLKGTPVCVKISRSGKNVSYLSRTHVDVYGINIAKDSRKLAMNKLFGYDLEKNTSDGSTQFTSTALNDQYMAVLTREKVSRYSSQIISGIFTDHDQLRKLFIIDFSNPLTPSSAVYSDHQKVSRFCSVAVSSAARPTLAALGLVDRENNAIVHIYELQESKQGKKLDAKFHRTLEFGDYVKCPHGDPRGLSFSADGLYVVCTSSLRGDILVWDLASPSRSPKFRAEVPINDGLVSSTEPVSPIPN